MDSVRNICLLGVLLIIPVESFPEGSVHYMKMSDFADVDEFSPSQIEQFSTPWLTNHKVFDYIRKLEKSKSMMSPKLVGAFKWKSCDGTIAPLINLQNLSISPESLHFPSTVYFAFTALIKKTVDGPLKVNITLKREIAETFWLTIPCIDGIGSCIIEDLCETLEDATCPDPFVKNDIPCKCPFAPGHYKMPKSQSGISIPFKDVPTGSYYAKFNLHYDNQLVTCLEIYFTIVEKSNKPGHP